jgi:hypothetical protein
MMARNSTPTITPRGLRCTVDREARISDLDALRSRPGSGWLI